MGSEETSDGAYIPPPKLPHGQPLVRVMAMPADANPNGDIFGGLAAVANGSRRGEFGGLACPGAMRNGRGRRHGLPRAGLCWRRGQLLR